MAKFDFQIADPNTKAASIPQRGVVDNSDAGLLNAVSGLVGAAGKSLDKARQEKELRKGNETLAGLQEDILTVDTERRQLAQDEESLRSQSLAIHADGVVTPDEAETLTFLESERDRLQGLRKTKGNAQAASIRLNTLQKTALANPENVMIQSNINALFSQGRSQVAKAIESPEMEALRSKMDFKHGQGNWDLIQLGKQQAIDNQIATDTQRGAAYLTANSQRMSGIVGSTVEPIILGLTQAIGSSGVVDPTALNASKQGIRTSFSQMRSNYLAGVANERATGAVIDQASVDSFLKQAEELEAGYINKLDNLGETPLEALKKLNEYTNETIIQQSPLAPGTFRAMMNDPEALEAHLRMLQDPNMGKLLALNDPLGRSQGELIAQASQTLALILTGKVSMRDTVRVPASQQAFFAKTVDRTLKGSSPATLALKQEAIEVGNTLGGDIRDSDSKAFINSSIASSIRYVNEAPANNKEKSKAVVRGTMVKTWLDLVRRADDLNNPIKVTVVDGVVRISTQEPTPAIGRGRAARIAGTPVIGANVNVINSAIQEFISGVSKLESVNILSKGDIFSPTVEEDVAEPAKEDTSGLLNTGNITDEDIANILEDPKVKAAGITAADIKGRLGR